MNPAAIDVLVSIPDMPEELRAFFHTGLADLPHVRLHFAAPDPAQLAADAARSDVVLAWRLPPAAFEAAKRRMQLWLYPGVGVQHLIEPFREINQTRRAIVCNSHGNAYGVAQHAVALLLTLLNRVLPHHEWMKQGLWRTGDDEAATVPLRGQRVGLLGYGAINRYVHLFLAGFEVTFAAVKRDWYAPASFDPQIPLDRYTPADLPQFLQASDIVFVAVPITVETMHLLGADELGLLGPQGILVNIARGDVVEEEALYRALKHGGLGGAALDVWYDYHPQPDSAGRLYPFHFPFSELPHVILSPHRAASPIYGVERWRDTLDNLRRYAQGQPLRNVVDLERGY